MLYELESSRLEVCKVRSEQGGYVRLASMRNAKWYRDVCASFLGRRRRYPRPRTIIKRGCTIAALKRIENGNLAGTYAARLLPIVKEIAKTIRMSRYQDFDRTLLELEF